ncbi:ECF-type sigma factor [Rubripirellula amarantea]|uniref:RNA polymerase sigma factor n=1 Tax=Rubripirellula amarantea TaxID=2527999 RepID=A0A5C5WQX9_9BACT|nr:ECF-type sigma factor [Rubripirellula amarantea]MDA8745100.1 ECF-type sigma factor [Rubripirellula amarantea]TWT52947.1 RNA polymerase sigma factor [Rubripirellula amarantea]
MNRASKEDSITVWFDQLREGDPNAAAKLWDRLFESLANVAREQLSNRRVRDEEDVAAGVMTTLCKAADRGTLPSIDSRDDLWRMLLSWTKNDCIDHGRNNVRAKRGGGKVRGDSVFDDSSGAGFDLIADVSPSPATLTELNEQLQTLLEKLGDKMLCEIAVAKMEGYSNEELAEHYELSSRTIERKLAMIRKRWSGML